MPRQRSVGVEGLVVSAVVRTKRAVAVLGLITAATAGAVAVQRARQQRAASAGPVGLSGRAARTAAMAKMGTKAGGSYAVHRARRVFASAERQVELDSAFELRTAEQVAEVLGNMKGALMKLGQMASYLDQGMPEPVRAALAELQQNAPPMSGELAGDVIESQLGARPEQLFAEWDPRPIAAASIGQVHRAMTKDGRAVAVKVQYPGVGDAIRADLDNADAMIGVLGMVFAGLEPEPLIAELRDRLVEELDYRIEAENQQLFVDYYRDHPFIHIPEVVPELSTGLVLTTELAEGSRFDQLLTWSQDERNLAAEAIFRFVFRSLYRFHIFNGDPHPGNYLFRPGGQVTFLDFGLVKRFAIDDVDHGFASMIRAAVLNQDPAELRSVVERLGLLQKGTSLTDAEITDYFRHFFEFILTDEVTTIEPEYASETIRRMFDASGPHGKVLRASNLPPSFVIIQRINLGLYAILGQLRATANFRRVANELWPFVDGPASTDLGRAEAAWLESHPR
jgi:predicted unusual protein kinase regulating ubiquinone biosynthesis (AarF/ABC1/UbiB family)